MAKIAVEFEERAPAPTQVASGEGWTVRDLVCTAGPRDRAFEEQHSSTSVAVVVSGTFQYRSRSGTVLMTPGSLLLGNAGDCFTCGHEHGTGDRCLSFSYTPEFFEGLAGDGASSATRFKTPRLPVARALSPIVAKAASLVAAPEHGDFEALAIRLASHALKMGASTQARGGATLEASSLARVTRVVRAIENEPEAEYDLGDLARLAGLSSYHFLRTFVAVTGVTPHQYLLRVRLRRAALSLKSERMRVVDVALGSGFGDVSNFNRAFRAEFGVSPRVYRALG